MDEEAIKILEISGDAWMGGISLQPSMAVGGLFRTALNFDPFKVMGVFSPSIAGTQQGTASITTGGAFNVGFEVNGVSYFYSFADGSKVYRINTSSNIGDVDVVSSSISDVATIRGAIKHKKKIVYASNTSLKFNNTDTSSPGDGFTLANQRGLISLTTGGVHVMVTGPDRNLYVTNINKVARITTMTAESGGVPASGNTNSYLTFEDDVFLRDVKTDGKYLVLLGDTNNRWVSGANTKVRCFVAFWNMKSQDLTQIWEFEDVVTYGMEFDGEEFIVHGRDNVYTCNIDTPISPLISRRGNTNLVAALVHPGSVIRKDGSVYWGEGSRVWAYGRPNKLLKKILYQPYFIDSGNALSLFPHHDGMWVMTDNNKLYEYISGSQVITATATLADIDFKTKYRFSFAKIILRDVMASGDAVDLQISTQNGNKIVLNSNGMNFANHGAISSKRILPEAIESSNDSLLFEDLTSIQIESTNGANIRRVEIWAIPIDPQQDSGY